VFDIVAAGYLSKTLDERNSENAAVIREHAKARLSDGHHQASDSRPAYGIY
jgi:hypothetical protein